MAINTAKAKAVMLLMSSLGRLDLYENGLWDNLHNYWKLGAVSGTRKSTTVVYCVYVIH